MNSKLFKIMSTVVLVFVIITLLGGCDNVPIADTIIDDTNPVITVTGVEDGEVYNTAVTPQISADEDVTWDIVLTKDGNSVDYARGDSINQVGEYVITIKATDNSGNEQVYGSISFKFSDDHTSPSVNITSPSDGDTIGENPVTVQWEINDESTYTWELYIGGTTNPNATGDQSSVHEYTFDPADIFESYSGTVRIRIEATDEVGNDSSDHVDVTVETRADLIFGDNGGGTYWWDVSSGNLIIYVANDGPSTAGESTVEVYFSNDDRTEYIDVPTIDPGENIELPGVEMPSVGGGENIYFDVILDVYEEVDESNENNNEDSDFLVT